MRRRQARPMSAGKRSREKMMIDEQRGEERREVRNRISEGAPRERIAVVRVKACCVAQEYSVQDDCGGEVSPAAHPVGEREQRRSEQNQRVEQHVQPSEA